MSVALTRAAPATLELRCPLLDVQATLDGELVNLSGPEPLQISAREHQLRLARAGYLPRQVAFRAASGERIRIPCALERDPHFSKLAWLTLRRPRDAEARIDGVPSDGGALPEGRHTLTLSGASYQPYTSVVELRAGESRKLEVQPQRSSDWLIAEQARRARARRVVGYVSGGVGLAAIASAGVIYLAGSDDRREWDQQSAELTRRLQQDPNSLSASDLDWLIERENAIRDRDSVALGLGVGGAIALVVGGALVLWSDAPARPVLSGKNRRVGLELHF